VDVIPRGGQLWRHLKELFLLWETRTGKSGKSADGIEHVGAAVGLAEVGCTTYGHRLFPCFFVVMRSDEDDRRGVGHIRELLRELDARHTAELDIEYKAVKSRMLRICEEGFGRGISDRPNLRRTQQSAERSAKAFVIIDDGDVNGCGATRWRHMSTIAAAAKYGLLPLREGGPPRAQDASIPPLRAHAASS
jgi:hypothetical protein